VNGQFVDSETVLRLAQASELILLGEIHDNAEHHRLQGRLLAQLAERKAPPVLLLEQFDSEQQGALDGALAAGTEPSTLMRGWDAAQYRPLLALAIGRRMPIVAANLSRNAARPLVREGFAAMPAAALQTLAIDAAWDQRRDQFLSAMIDGSHCGAISASLRDGLVKAQRWRDATLADAALRHSTDFAVFILGRGHARRDIGVPRYVTVRRPGTRVLSIGFVEVSAGKFDPRHYEADNAGEYAHDLLWFTPRQERPDPCLAFRKS
jgi:uncharacterized iron-regulated protein